jgi:competence protein ComEC
VDRQELIKQSHQEDNPIRLIGTGRILLLLWSVCGALAAFQLPVFPAVAEISVIALLSIALLIILAQRTGFLFNKQCSFWLSELLCGLLIVSIVHFRQAEKIQQLPIVNERASLGSENIFVMPLQAENNRKSETRGEALVWQKSKSGEWQQQPGRLKFYQRKQKSLIPGQLYIAQIDSAQIPWIRYDESRNPGAVNFRKMFGRKGISGKISRVVIENLQNCGYADIRTSSNLNLKINQLRQQIAQTFNLYSQPTYAAFQSAILLGLRFDLDAGLMNNFRKSGLSHLLAVSGLHVGVLAYCLWLMLAVFRIKEKARALILSILLLAYIPIAGAQPSVIRAVIMAVFILLGKSIERPQPLIRCLLSSAILTLILFPGQIVEPGFQLSYLAVFSILCIRITIEKDLHSIFGVMRFNSKLKFSPQCKWTVSAISTSLAVQAGTAAVSLMHFGRIALSGIVLNLLAIPLGSFLLVLTLLQILPGMSLPAAELGNLLFAILGVLSTAGAEISFEYCWRPNIWQALLIASGIFLALWPEIRRIPASFAAAFLILFAADLGPGLQASGSMDLIMLDVDQGDSSLIRYPDGSSVLIDTGWANPFGGRNLGRERVLPLLEKFCPKGLKQLLLTHPDQDHLGGAEFLLKNIPVSTVIYNGEWRDNRSNSNLRDTIEDLQIDLQEALPGMLLDKSKTVRLKVMGPPPTGVCKSGNERSIILLVEYFNTRILLNADAGFEEEEWLLNWGEIISGIDILKLGHHGSSGSSSAEFLEFTQASLGLISAGRRNRYGHPAAELLQRCKGAGIDIFRTDLDGACWIRINEHGWNVLDWRGMQIWSRPRGFRLGFSASKHLKNL